MRAAKLGLESCSAKLLVRFVERFENSVRRDLQQIAGTGEIVAFGSRWEGVPRVRRINDKPANPDPYTLNTGLTKVRGNNQYAPIRALLDFKQ